MSSNRTPTTTTGHEREWLLDEVREECAEHMESGAADLPAERARLIVMLVDHRKRLVTAFERLTTALVEGESLHETDDDGNDVCGEDHDACECDLPTLINATLKAVSR